MEKENIILDGEDILRNYENLQKENPVTQDQLWWESAMFPEPARDSER